MPPINILIKPASSRCNMNCSYCFYKDVANNRRNAVESMLTTERMEQIIRTGMEYASGICSFTYQGGEPTLAGLDFFRTVVELQKKYQRPGTEIRNSIQTNGYCIDDEWASFFAKNRFLVGLSLDGPSEAHNKNRLDHSGKGTFNKVMHTVSLFDRYGVDYNILSVVTGENARHVRKIYGFYKKQGFHWLQFIPCLEPLGKERGETEYHLSAEAYGSFLINLFDLWMDDLKKGKYISIRHLDNWMGILLGEQPEACNMTGRCSIQYVVEGDGGVYPCDFYVLDEYRLGTVGEENFCEMTDSDVAERFCTDSCRIPEECRKCEFFPLCRNGCRRDRLVTEDGMVDINYYCSAYKRFFTERRKEIGEAVRIINGMRAERYYNSEG